MEPFSVLQTMAEVAAGFAGFTAVLLALLSRDVSLSAIRTGIIHFLQLSLGAVLIAFLPSVLSSLLSTDSAIWQISNAAQGLYHYYLLWWIFSKEETSVGHSQMGKTLMLALAVCGFSIATLNIFVAIGLFQNLLIFAFLFGLLWYLAMALVNFVTILLYRLNLE